jgi:hypothetical protein
MRFLRRGKELRGEHDNLSTASVRDQRSPRGNVPRGTFLDDETLSGKCYTWDRLSSSLGFAFIYHFYQL